MHAGDRVDRHGVEQAPVGQQPSVDHDGRDHPRDRHRRANGDVHRTGGEPHLAAGPQVGCDRGVGNGEIFDAGPAEHLGHAGQHPFDLEGTRPERRRVDQPQHVARAQAGHPVGVVVELAGGLQPADHRPHRGAGDAADGVPAFVEHLYGADLRVTPRTPGAQYQCDPSSHASIVFHRLMEPRNPHRKHTANPKGAAGCAV